MEDIVKYAKNDSHTTAVAGQTAFHKPVFKSISKTDKNHKFLPLLPNLPLIWREWEGKNWLSSAIPDAVALI